VNGNYQLAHLADHVLFQQLCTNMLTKFIAILEVKFIDLEIFSPSYKAASVWVKRGWIDLCRDREGLELL